MKKLIYLLLVLASNIFAPTAAGQTLVEMQPNCVGPEYPSASKRLEEEGTVTLRFSVGTDGKVISAEVEKSSAFKRLDQAARSSLLKCQFKPFLKDGVPIEVSSQKKYTFRLETGKIDSPVPYKVSAANGELLRNGNFPKMRFFSFSEPESLSINCRIANNPLYVSATNISINKFIENAFNSELQAAGLYSEQGTLLTADIKRIASSTFPSGSWDLELDLKLENGKKINYYHSHKFPLSTMDGLLSCPKAAQEFPIAIQQLFYKIADSKALIEPSK
jgi:TonB family protein